MSKPPIPAPHVATIEGQQTLVVPRTPPLPQKLDQLLSALFGVRVSNDIRPGGATTACTQWRTHRFEVLREGRHLGSDRVLRDLRIEMCLDCGAVCVRDISFDLTFEGERVPMGRGGARRRDLILGWYSGARRGQRTYS